MKKILFPLMTVVLLGLSACQKSDDGNGGGGGGTTAETPCNISGNTTCNPGYYNQDPRLSSFPAYQWSNNNGFCGCPIGQRPIMNPQWGISCAPDSYWGGNYNYLGYNYGNTSSVYSYYGQNTQWSSVPQVSYTPAVSGAGNCYANAASACDIRDQNSCGGGAYCRATGGGSYIGLCTVGAGTSTYSNNSGSCWQNSPGWGRIYVCGYNNNGYYYPRSNDSFYFYGSVGYGVDPRRPR